MKNKKKKKYQQGGQNYDAMDAKSPQMGGGQDYSNMSIEQLKKLAQKGDKKALAELRRRMQQQGQQQQSAPQQMKKGGMKKKKKRQNLWDC